MFQIIPAIDLLNGQVVRLTQGDYNQVEQYSLGPSQFAKRFEQMGAKRLHLVDLDGAKSGARINQSVIQDIRQSVRIPLQLGGGIRTLESARWYFDLGVDFIILGSLIIKNPEEARHIVDTYPGKCFAGIDVKNEEVVTQGWTENTALSLWDCLESLQEWPLAGIVFTDTAKDGMMAGPNIELIQKITQYQNRHSLIAAGGVSTESDIATLAALAPEKLLGCIVGKAALAGKVDLTSILRRYSLPQQPA